MAKLIIPIVLLLSMATTVSAAKTESNIKKAMNGITPTETLVETPQIAGLATLNQAEDAGIRKVYAANQPKNLNRYILLKMLNRTVRR